MVTKKEEAQARQSLIPEILRVYNEVKGQHNYLDLLLKALNERGIKPLRTAQWARGGLWLFLRNNVPQIVDDRAKRKGDKVPKQPSKRMVEKPRPSKKTGKTINVSTVGVKEVIPLRAHRPLFLKKLQSRQATVRIKEEVYIRAVGKLQKDRVRVGDSLSSLVNILLWMYAGADETLIEKNLFIEEK